MLRTRGASGQRQAALGCAASAAEGTGCAGGAIGGAISAATANEIATAVTDGQGVTDQTQLAAITAATMLLGGGAAALLGQNVSGAVTAAENETLNNTCGPGHHCGVQIESAPSGDAGLQIGAEKDTVPILPSTSAPDEEQAEENGQSLVVGQGLPVGMLGGAAIDTGTGANDWSDAASGSAATGTSQSTALATLQWPPNGGVWGTAQPTTLDSGTLIDRFGNPTGTYAAPAGAAFNTRGLPVGSYDAPYNAYQVVSPLTVQQSYVMPWFGSTTGIQFRLPQSVNSLLEQGILAPVTLPKPPFK